MTMLTKEYKIEGMTCQGCVAHVKETLEQSPKVEKADISLENANGLITGEGLTLNDLQQLFANTKYHFSESATEVNAQVLPEKSITTYKPLILIVLFIGGFALLSQYPFTDFSGMLWMRHFMAGFFIVFSFFKLLNLKGFADSYAMYDLLAGKWKGWGYIYPFVELGLGAAYLINYSPFYTNVMTIVVLGFSSLGVIKSNMDKRQIKCACLGDVFNLPMSTVTIVEDLTMVGMAFWMIL